MNDDQKIIIQLTPAQFEEFKQVFREALLDETWKAHVEETLEVFTKNSLSYALDQDWKQIKEEMAKIFKKVTHSPRESIIGEIQSMEQH